ncbi:hypothetical protein E0Z10_g10745 [Xylaria hypoxylon]|uniref:Uncharacterized protein n=1 Tax=Xylaria hypoxylon TaxID=37992 RepID=A0A4Z0Y066_9PEZI|nr:hypothetical protein E0Z10_g10745 [Xylaria hypoxylon]
MPERVCTAESILDYLTVKNPKVRSNEQVNARQSDRMWWSFPTHVEPWYEFNFETVEQIFDGNLMRECRDARNTFNFFEPALVPGAQDLDSGEPAATAILTLWTNTVVNKVFLVVKDTLHPVQWAPQSSSARTGPGETQSTSKQAEKGTRAEPHILAGNNHELAWEYGPLKEEALRTDGEGPNHAASQVTQASQAKQDPQKPLAVEIPSTGSFASVAQSHFEPQDIPTQSGHEDLSYLQRSFATESETSEGPSMGRRIGKRALDLDADEAESSAKRRGRGRPRKET